MDLKSLWEAAKIIEAESPVFHNRAIPLKLTRSSGSPSKDPPESYIRSAYSPNSKKSTANRLNHNNLEKCRRAYLRDCLGNLRSFIPKSNDCNKATTLSLLVTSKDFISSMQVTEDELRDSLLKEFQRFNQIRKVLSTHMNLVPSHIPDQIRTIQSCTSDVFRERLALNNTEDEFSSTDSNLSFKSDDSVENASCRHAERHGSGSYLIDSEKRGQCSVYVNGIKAEKILATDMLLDDMDSKHHTDEDRRDSSSEYSGRNDSPLVDYDSDHLYRFDSLGQECTKSAKKECPEDKPELEKTYNGFGGNHNPPTLLLSNDGGIPKSYPSDCLTQKGISHVGCSSDNPESQFMDCVEDCKDHLKQEYASFSSNSFGSDLKASSERRRSVRRNSLSSSVTDPYLSRVYDKKIQCHTYLSTSTRRHRDSVASSNVS